MYSGFRLATALLLFGLSVTVTLAQEDDRPILKHQTAPMQMEDTAEALTPPVKPAPKKSPEIAPGLTLPEKGHAWALDSTAGTPQFSQLKFSSTHWNNHRGENLTKSAVAPFVFKQKVTLELQGASAKLRLHDPAVAFYVRSIYSVDDNEMNDEEYAEPRLSLVKLEVHGDNRVASTVNFGRVTLKPQRSDGVIETRMERVGTTSWFKITSLEPLASGEYGLVPLPKTQNAYSTVVLDFAIDPAAKTTN